MKKFILHKPSATIYIFTSEPEDRYLGDIKAGKSIILKGMGSYGLEFCEIIEPRTKIESFLFNLLYLYQSNIRNNRLKYKIKNTIKHYAIF